MKRKFGVYSIVFFVVLMCFAFSVFVVNAANLSDKYIVNDVEGNDVSLPGEVLGFLGDANKDEKVNIKDATTIQKSAAVLIELDEVQTIIADVDQNGKVNVKDATAIQKWVASIQVNMPINHLVYIPNSNTDISTQTTVDAEPTETTDIETCPTDIKETTYTTEPPIETTITGAGCTDMTEPTSSTEPSDDVIHTDPGEGETTTAVVTEPTSTTEPSTSIPKEDKFTVIFVNYDGTVLKEQSVESGNKATAPSNPTRPATAQYTYTFSGWDKDFSMVTGDLTVTAQYSFKVNSYTVTFVNWDGTKLKGQSVEYGKSATAPNNPVRSATAQYTYTFIGWDKTFSNVIGDMTITAQYRADVNKYTVTFVDWDGTTIKAQSVEFGMSATDPSNPSRDGYRFIGWDKVFTNITSDLTITALYENVSATKYTVEFTDYDGTVLSTQTVAEGASAALPTSPTKSGTAFVGWSGNYVNVTQNETVRAVYSDEKNVFVVESASGGVGDTVTVLVSVDGSVKTCGFAFDLFYDEALELVSYDNDLDLDVIVNDKKYDNGIKLNFSAVSDKTKQRDIIELTFKIKDTDKSELPVVIQMTEVFEILDSGVIKQISYAVVDGVVKIR